MADINDLKTRSAALAPRVQAALQAANAAGQLAATASAQATISDDLNAIDAGIAAVEALAPPLPPVQAVEQTGTGQSSTSTDPNIVG